MHKPLLAGALIAILALNIFFLTPLGKNIMGDALQYDHCPNCSHSLWRSHKQGGLPYGVSTYLDDQDITDGHKFNGTASFVMICDECLADIVNLDAKLIKTNLITDCDWTEEEAQLVYKTIIINQNLPQLKAVDQTPSPLK
jgi:hypothetical protein